MVAPALTSLACAGDRAVPLDAAAGRWTLLDPYSCLPGSCGVGLDAVLSLLLPHAMAGIVGSSCEEVLGPRFTQFCAAAAPGRRWSWVLDDAGKFMQAKFVCELT